MKHLFIVNPIAGGKKVKYENTVSVIKAVMEECGEPYEIYITKFPMDACEKVKKESEKGDELRVYACGGDGTFNECVNGVVGFKNAAVTSYPCGTGNDFIKMFDAEAKLFQDIKALVFGEKHDMDVICCNGRYSANICSVGIDARIGTDVHKYSHLPVIGGATGYVVSLVVNLIKGISSRYTVKTENYSKTGNYTLICACNGRYYGGGFNPVPDARPDDGLIDFLLVDKTTALQFLSLVSVYASGGYKKLTRFITHVKSRFLEIESEKDIVVNVDGEALYSKKVRFELVPSGINFIAPENMDFFKK